MKIKGLIAITIIVTMVLSSCSTGSFKNAKLATENDTLSYAIGTNFYSQLKNDSIFLNPAVLAKSLVDAKEGKSVMSDAQLQEFFARFSAKMQVVTARRQEEEAKKQAEANKITFKSTIAEGDSFLNVNKSRKGVIVTESGLQYEVIKMGTGKKPTAENTVKVHYTGTHIDGTKFDSSYDRKEPAEFMVSNVIKGWTEALQLMPVGSKFKIYIPENLAYGSTGAGDVIKPYSTLIFEVELLDIVK
jgi:FKBP-type peptidyl-prolyl cis-trans isomerase FklB